MIRLLAWGFVLGARLSELVSVRSMDFRVGLEV